MHYARTGAIAFATALAACSPSAPKAPAPTTASTEEAAGESSKSSSSNTKVTIEQDSADQAQANAGKSQSSTQIDTPPSAPAAAAPPAVVIPQPNDPNAAAGGALTVASGTTAAGTATTNNTKQVTFHIAAGTGNGAWNTEATPIKVAKGQTLQIVNDDSVTHWVHSNELLPGTGGGPFPHPFSGIGPGQSASYKVDNNYGGQLHDHATQGAIYFAKAPQ